MSNKVTILGDINLSWIDTKIYDDIFRRDIGNSSIFFMAGVLRKKTLPGKAFTPLKTDTQFISDFVTIDIETI
jgi:hypothetical protein